MPRPARPRRPAPPLERDVQKAILAYLRARGVVAWRNNVGTMAGLYKGKRWFVRFGTKGASDLAGILPSGMALFVEVKRPGKRPTPAQVAFLRSAGAAGACAFWADSVGVVERVLDAIERGLRVELDGDGRQWTTDEGR